MKLITGSRVVRDGANEEGVPDLLRRGGRHRGRQVRRRSGRRQRGAEDHAGTNQPAGRLRRQGKHQG